MKEQKQWFKNKYVIIGAAVVVVVVSAIVAALLLKDSSKNKSDSSSTATDSQTQTRAQTKPTAQNCVSDDCLAVDGLNYPAGQLPGAVSEAVDLALDNEYKAYSLYQAITAKIGSVRPFSMVIRAEESHIASLKAILDKYGEQIPANPYVNKLTAMATKQENCQLGIDVEVANVALYRDRLLPVVTAYPDITAVFTALMNASNDKHLPAFQKCN